MGLLVELVFQVDAVDAFFFPEVHRPCQLSCVDIAPSVKDDCNRFSFGVW